MRYKGEIQQVKEIETILRKKVPFHLIDKGEKQDLFGIAEPSKFQVLRFHFLDNRDAAYIVLKCIYDYRDNTAMVVFAERDGGRIFRMLPSIVKLIGELKPYYGEQSKNTKVSSPVVA